ncbi:hypothetical protein LY76DRAFT_99705 [Colletotrichum caudatum]|nr:hypothetical protein LY76DRAFT_99705 [Colletotrichum caudatum]
MGIKRQHICIYHGDAEGANAVTAGSPRGRIDRSPPTLTQRLDMDREPGFLPLDARIDSRACSRFVESLCSQAAGLYTYCIVSRSAGHLSYFSVSPTASERRPEKPGKGPVCLLDPRGKNIKNPRKPPGIQNCSIPPILGASTAAAQKDHPAPGPVSRSFETTAYQLVHG